MLPTFCKLLNTAGTRSFVLHRSKLVFDVLKMKSFTLFCYSTLNPFFFLMAVRQPYNYKLKTKKDRLNTLKKLQVPLPPCFLLPASILLPSCFHPASILLPSCFHPASCFLPALLKPTSPSTILKTYKFPFLPKNLQIFLKTTSPAFHPASILLPSCFYPASILLPSCPPKNYKSS
jgi:hypothetical protein